MSNYNNSIRYTRPLTYDRPGPRYNTPINRHIPQNNIQPLVTNQTNPQQSSNKLTAETNTINTTANRNIPQNNSNSVQLIIPKPNTTQQQSTKPTAETNIIDTTTNRNIPQNNSNDNKPLIPNPSNTQQQQSNKPISESNTSTISPNLNTPKNNSNSVQLIIPKPNSTQQQSTTPTTETNASISISSTTSNPSSTQNQTKIPEPKTTPTDSSNKATSINNPSKTSTKKSVEEQWIGHSEQKRSSSNQQSTNSTSQKNPQGGRARLFIGNLPSDITQEEFQSLLGKYGEFVEYYVNPARGFGFIKFNARSFAEKVKTDLDGYMLRGKELRIRFANQGALIKVKNLSSNVSNELLKEAFEQYFGPVERAVVFVDGRGKSIGEGIVEFEKKPAAQKCLNDCTERCFFLTKDSKPIIVEPWDIKNEDDGLPEKTLIHNDAYYKERQLKPRFAEPNTIEYTIGIKWKQLELQEKQLLEEVKRRIQLASEQLQVEVGQMLLEHESQVLRDELTRRQEELRRIEELRLQEFDRHRNIMSMHHPDAYNTSLGNAFHQNQAASTVYPYENIQQSAYRQSSVFMQQPNPIDSVYMTNQIGHGGYNGSKRPNIHPADVDYNQHQQGQGFDRKRPRY